MRNMQDKAQLKVAIDRAVAEEFLTQPNSVVFMTCFAQQARNSSEVGGEIFSGDFTGSESPDEGLAPVVNAQLRAHAENFTRVPEYENGTLRHYYEGEYLDITQATAGGPCNALEELWRAQQEEGVNKRAPYVTMDDVVNGNIPSTAGDIFRESIESPATRQLVTNYRNSLANLDQPTATPNCSNSKNLCEVQTCLNNGTKPPGCP